MLGLIITFHKLLCWYFVSSVLHQKHSSKIPPTYNYKGV